MGEEVAMSGVVGNPDIEDFGIIRRFEVGLRVSVSSDRLPALTRPLEDCLHAFPQASARLVGFGMHRSHLDLTLAVSLGTTEDVVTRSPAAQAGVELLAHLVTELADFLPALRELPAPASDEALVAVALREGETLGRLPAPVAASTRALVAAIG